MFKLSSLTLAFILLTVFSTVSAQTARLAMTQEHEVEAIKALFYSAGRKFDSLDARRKFYDEVLTEDFEAIGADGTHRNKREFIEAQLRAALILVTLKIPDVSIKLNSSSTAEVESTFEATYEDGRIIKIRGRDHLIKDKDKGWQKSRSEIIKVY